MSSEIGQKTPYSLRTLKKTAIGSLMKKILRRGEHIETIVERVATTKEQRQMEEGIEKQPLDIEFDDKKSTLKIRKKVMRK